MASLAIIGFMFYLAEFKHKWSISEKKKLQINNVNIKPLKIDSE
jgi:hypothetical protein